MFGQLFEFLKNRSFLKNSKNQRRGRFGSLKKKIQNQGTMSFSSSKNLKETMIFMKECD